MRWSASVAAYGFLLSPLVTIALGAILIRRAADERKLSQVPRQANARAHHDISLRPTAAKPFADRIGQVIKYHV
jgi:hypothetical protein